MDIPDRSGEFCLSRDPKDVEGLKKGYISLNIYAFNRHFYPKRLTVHSGHTFVLSVYVCSLGIEPTTFALLMQCSNH